MRLGLNLFHPMSFEQELTKINFLSALANCVSGCCLKEFTLSSVKKLNSEITLSVDLSVNFSLSLSFLKLQCQMH